MTTIAGELEMRARRFDIKELMGYLAASVAGLAVDLGVLMLCVEVFSLNEVPSSVIGFMSGALVVYLISARAVFSTRRVKNELVESLIFVALGCGGLVVTAATMWVGLHLLHLDYKMSKALAVAFSFTSNFLLRKSILFSKG